MSNIPIGGYGGCNTNLIPTYGYGDGTLNVVPTYGSMLGGDEFIITGRAITNLIHRDPFSSIDPSKWNTVLSGSGSVSVSNGVILSIGTASGSATIESISQYTNCDLRISYAYDRSIQYMMPSSDITFCEFGLRVSADTVASIGHYWSSISGAYICANVISSGITIASKMVPADAARRYLRVARYSGRIKLWCDAQLLLDCDGWSDVAATAYFVASTSSSLPLVTTSTIHSFQPVTIITFGDNMADGVIEYGSTRVMGFTPFSRIPCSVDVFLHTLDATIQISDRYRYTKSNELNISEKLGSVVITNDSALRSDE